MTNLFKDNLYKAFKGKKVIVTGHTGFKGSWLTTWLNALGADVTGISINVPTSPSNFKANQLQTKINDIRCDVTDLAKTMKLIKRLKPDFVFHLAAQSLVKKSYDSPLLTWQTNLIGTVNVLESLRRTNKECYAVIITSDKCYDNVEWLWGYRENDKLGGPDPYSASKGAAEIAINSYFKSFFSRKESKVRVASARAGNVIGGGDWAEDRIIPDCVKSWSRSNKVKIRNPKATRPWQHVLEPLSGYLKLAIDLKKNKFLNGESFNFGPSAENDFTVKELVISMSQFWDKVSWIDISKKTRGPYESNLLKLNCDKALKQLGWRPTLDYHKTIEFTALWYKAYYEDKKSIIDLTSKQIQSFMDMYDRK